MPILDVLTPEIEATIGRLVRKRFAPDPIAGQNFSRITSIVSSAYKRHGHIIERAILEQLKTCEDLEVWTDPVFAISRDADGLANNALGNPASIIGNNINYGESVRTLQVDLLVYDRRKRSLRCYEIKRGFGIHDSGKKRQILRDVLCLQALLRSYGARRELDIVDSSSHVIFYYGRRSVPAPFSIIGDEVDAHFDWPVKDAVEEVNGQFQKRLFEILEAAPD